MSTFAEQAQPQTVCPQAASSGLSQESCCLLMPACHPQQDTYCRFALSKLDIAINVDGLLTAARDYAARSARELHAKEGASDSMSGRRGQVSLHLPCRGVRPFEALPNFCSTAY